MYGTANVLNITSNGFNVNLTSSGFNVSQIMNGFIAIYTVMVFINQASVWCCIVW